MSGTSIFGMWHATQQQNRRRCCYRKKEFMKIGRFHH
jgi:hypothetical protein